MTLNSYTVAISKAANAHTFEVGMCDYFVAWCYGLTASGYFTALDHWNASTIKHPSDMNPPAGALCFWGNGAGHVALSIGGGTVWSTDIGGAGTVTLSTISHISTAWGKPYLGWAVPQFQDQYAVIAAQEVTMLGADSTTSSVSALNSLGCKFISRYTSEQSWHLTASEAQALTNAGIYLVSNYEHLTTDWQGGNSQGVKNANTAVSVCNACGMPAGRPIYFSVDMDASPSAVVNSGYFQGINSVIGAARTGVYASTGVCNALRAAGLVHWTWRTMSTGWSGGAGDPSMFNVMQIYPPFNGTYDQDQSVTTDFGQWFVGGAPTPTPTPTPTPSTDPTPAEVWSYSGNDLTGPPDQPDVHQSLLSARDNFNMLVGLAGQALTAMQAMNTQVVAIKTKLGA